MSKQELCSEKNRKKVGVTFYYLKCLFSLLLGTVLLGSSVEPAQVGLEAFPPTAASKIPAGPTNASFLSFLETFWDAKV